MKSQPHHIQGGRSRSVRTELIPLLNQRLADALHLQCQAKHAHWNVRGPGFFALHELFDQVAAELAGLADGLAERIAQLGGEARGTLQHVAASSTLPGHSAGIAAGGPHISALAEALRCFGASAHATIAAAGDCHDPVTADLLTNAAALADKLRWLVGSHAALRDRSS